MNGPNVDEIDFPTTRTKKKDKEEMMDHVYLVQLLSWQMI